MSGISKKIMIVLALCLVFVMLFAACSNMTQDPIAGGDANAVVENNGGLVVKQGEYLYYINGLTATTDIKDEKDNTFGNVIKGSLMRGKLDKDGKISDCKIVVPKIVLSANKAGGIYVFGNWIYYTSPSIKKDTDGVLQTSYLDYMRTSIDGTKTEVIATVDGQSTEYKFTDNALVYYDADKKLVRVPYDNDKVGKAETIAEEVTDVLFPVSSTYNPSGKAVDDVVFYTKAADDEKATYNVTYVVGTKTGSAPVAWIDGNTYGQEKKDQYTISLNTSRVTENGIEVYYEKANSNNNENKAGIHGNLYKAGEKFDASKEVRFTDKTYTTVFPKSLEEGMYVLDSNKLYLMKEVIGEDGISTFGKDKYNEFSATVTIVDFIDYAFEDGKPVSSVLYIANNKFQVRALDDSLNYNAKMLSDDEYAVDSSWLLPEIIDGKVYFFNTEFYKYLDRIDIATGNMDKDDKGELSHPFANMNAADKKAEEEKKEEEKENK